VPNAFNNGRRTLSSRPVQANVEERFCLKHLKKKKKERKKDDCGIALVVKLWPSMHRHWVKSLLLLNK
jgi:hypothetical protein